MAFLVTKTFTFIDLPSYNFPLYFEVDVVIIIVIIIVIITSDRNAPHWFLHSAPRPAQ